MSGPTFLDTPTARTAIEAWRAFAHSLVFEFKGDKITWAKYAFLPGRADELQLVQPLAFPRFVEELLGFRVGDTVAPEVAGVEGKPDFTPADAVTHPFVFETKGTDAGVALHGFEQQVTRYLVDGRPRIKHVCLTNLIGLRVFELNEQGELVQRFRIDLRGLLDGEVEDHLPRPDAQHLLLFLTSFRFTTLGFEEKILRIREAPEWNPELEVTNPTWLSRRLDRVVRVLQEDVGRQVADGKLQATLTSLERKTVVAELRELEWRLGADWEASQERTLEQYLDAEASTLAALALAQYRAHVAYYTATRLMLVRVWEDLGLLQSMLHDGGFHIWMERFDDLVDRVVRHSFAEAGEQYPALFGRPNNYSWYRPSQSAYVEAIYELAMTYFGQIESHVLGDVYERLLERVDRKQIGQFYTPRDVIGLIWDLIGDAPLAEQADGEGRPLRVLDIATGSAGFLVEIARRLRDRADRAIEQGAALHPAVWTRRIAEGLVGVEIQRFPAYLAELNLLIQIGLFLSARGARAIPPLSILCADTMSLHNPEALLEGEQDEARETGLLVPDPEREAKVAEVTDPSPSDSWMDVACGNPPYVGEKRASPVLQRTRQRFPYWERFVAPHLDVLYWFLILGVSKLRQHGRFGFITTEYWLRADGGTTLRAYLAERCHIDRFSCSETSVYFLTLLANTP